MRTVDSRELMDEIEEFDPDDVTNIEKLQVAQTAILFALSLLEQVADATGDKHARAYLVDNLKTLTYADHGFLCGDFNIDEWIERIKKGKDEDREQ